MTKIEFREHINVSKTKTIDKWIEKGYLPGVVDPVTGVIDIPEDMPRPYKANGRTKKLPSLILELLKAGEESNSVYPAMFPQIRPDTFERMVQQLVEGGYLTVHYSSTNVRYLEITLAGIELLRQDKRDRQQTISNILTALNILSSAAPVLCTIIAA